MMCIAYSVYRKTYEPIKPGYANQYEKCVTFTNEADAYEWIDKQATPEDYVVIDWDCS